MADILEILNSRNRQHAQPSGSEQQMTSAIVIRVEGSRYLVNDGSHSFACESVLTEAPRTGMRVWVGKGKGVSVILGVMGKDVDFA